MKKQFGNSAAAVLSIAVLCAILGVVAGFAYLASIPVERFSDSAEYAEFLAERGSNLDPRPGDIGYFSGPGSVGEGWSAKRDALVAASGAVEFTAADLNGWFGTSFRGSGPAPEDASSIVMKPEMPVFYIKDGVLHLSFAVDVSAFGGASREYRVTTRGGFENGAAGPRFAPEVLYVGNARLPVAGAVTGKIFEMIELAFGKNEEYRAIETALAQADRIEVEDDLLRVRFK